MPCDYSKYPPNWKEIRQRILDRAGNKCEVCGVSNHAIGFRDATGLFNEIENSLQGETDTHDLVNEKIIKIVLTIAHLDHDAENHEVTDDRLMAMCQKCHNNYDKEYRAANRKATINNKKGLQELGL